MIKIEKAAAQTVIRVFLEREHPFPSRFERAARTASRPVAPLTGSLLPQPVREEAQLRD